MKALMVALAVVMAFVALGTRPVEAGRQGACQKPEAFPGAAVNTAVLQYLYEGPGGQQLSATAKQLSHLIQLDTLLSLLKHESIGVTFLQSPSGNAAQCVTPRIFEQLLGRVPGGQPVQQGHGLVVMSGRMYEERGQIYVQSRLEFRRRDRPEELRLAVADATGRPITFTGGLPSQVVAFPPRRFTAADLKTVDENFAKAAVVRSDARDNAPGKALDAEALKPFAYVVVDARADGWMKIQSEGSGPSGWVHAQIDPGLRALMPELSFIDAVVGYLRYRMDRDGPKVGRWAQPPSKVRDTLGQYLKRETSEAASDSKALALSLSAVLRVLETGSADRVTVPDRARDELGGVTTLIPYSPGAWALKAIADVPACCGPGGSPNQWEAVANSLLKAVAVGPRDTVTLANLEALYTLISGNPAYATSAPEIQRRLQEVQAVRAALRGR